MWELGPGRPDSQGPPPTLLGQMGTRPLRALCARFHPGACASPILVPPAQRQAHADYFTEVCGQKEGQSCASDAGYLVSWCCRSFKDLQVDGPYLDKQSGDKSFIPSSLCPPPLARPHPGLPAATRLGLTYSSPTPSQLPPSASLKWAPASPSPRGLCERHLPPLALPIPSLHPAIGGNSYHLPTYCVIPGVDSWC